MVTKRETKETKSNADQGDFYPQAQQQESAEERNFEYQYERVAGYIYQYLNYQRNLHKRLQKHLSFIDKYRFYFREIRQLDLLRGKPSDQYREIISNIVTEEEKGSEFYQVLLSNYPTNGLGASMESRFEGYDFEKLKKLNELKKSQLLHFNYKHAAGLILGATALVLKTIPKQIVLNFGIRYENFEIWIFWITVGVLAYLLLVLLPLWLKSYKADKLFQYIGYVLEYTALRKQQ